MPLEYRLDSRQTVIDFDDLPGERVETRFEAGESGVHAAFEAGEPGTHARFEAGEPCFHAGKSSANGIHLQNSRHDAHHNGEHRHTDREIQLNVSHALTSLYWQSHGRFGGRHDYETLTFFPVTRPVEENYPRHQSFTAQGALGSPLNLIG